MSQPYRDPLALSRRSGEGVGQKQFITALDALGRSEPGRREQRTSRAGLGGQRREERTVNRLSRVERDCRPVGRVGDALRRRGSFIKCRAGGLRVGCALRGCRHDRSRCHTGNRCVVAFKQAHVPRGDLRGPMEHDVQQCVQTFVDHKIVILEFINHLAVADDLAVVDTADDHALLFRHEYARAIINVVREFAEDLVKYAYYTSYDERGVNAFFHLVPIQYKIDNGYVSNIKEVLGQFKDGGDISGYSSIAQIGDDPQSMSFPSIKLTIARNMWDDPTIVPKHILDLKPNSNDPFQQ